jgi:hypothetical protein
MKPWFVWWIERPSAPGGGQWYGPVQRTDGEAFQEQIAIETSPGVSRIYRWFWKPPMPVWQYDERPNRDLIASGVEFQWL